MQQLKLPENIYEVFLVGLGVMSLDKESFEIIKKAAEEYKGLPGQINRGLNDKE